MNSIFQKDEFAVQIICTGSFLDDDPGYRGKVYQVETATVRLNHVALNEWSDTHISNCRECYETDQEWKDYLALKEARKRAFEEKVASAVGFHATKGISVAQVVSEVFTVAYIHEAKGESYAATD